jgi:DNA-binding HxlR family transcriptional regulator
MNKQISKRLRALEQATKPPEAILVRWLTDELNTLSTSEGVIRREDGEAEEVFIARGQVKAQGGVLFGW